MNIKTLLIFLISLTFVGTRALPIQAETAKNNIASDNFINALKTKVKSDSQSISQTPLCQIKLATPTKQTQKINQLGVSFRIPSNYRIESSKGYSDDLGDRLISILNPGHVQLLACCNRNKLAGCGHEVLTVFVNITKTRPEIANLDDITKQYSFEGVRIIKKTKIANQRAIVYSIIDPPTQDKYIEASFFNIDKTKTITIFYIENYPFNQQVFNTVVSSFALTK
ncbi:MAG: hypothetical protein V7L23_14560 [Nostoc sp.]|uniref:hypothetical protein n=1 Tax=Nostoc sp. TaxID=1180 RepID=UPI002FF22FF0